MRLSKFRVALAMPVVLGTGLALAEVSAAPNDRPIASQAQDGKDGFGRPETITGTIWMVKPEEELVVLAVRGPSQAPSTDFVVHTKTLRAGNSVIREEEVRTVPAPGETDFNFRVASSTLIKVDGHRLALGELSTLKGREATVRFVPQRDGNLALGIEVG